MTKSEAKEIREYCESILDCKKCKHYTRCNESGWSIPELWSDKELEIRSDEK